MTDHNPEVLKKSVTQDDYAKDPRAGVIHMMLPSYPYGQGIGQLPPEPPPYWSLNRDVVLRSTLYQEDFWSEAVGIAITKMAALGWEVKSAVPRRATTAQELLNSSNWSELVTLGLQDFLTTDNGQFIEIVRATKAYGSKIVGLVHLDSLRCMRTGDPEIPVIYRDRLGREHEMKWHQVISFADMPDPGATFFGVGKSAATRSYRQIYKMAGMARYVNEKITGRRPLAIHFVNSVSLQTLESAAKIAESDANQRGVMSYMGAIIVPLIDAEQQVSVATVPLAELPDGWNRKEEFDIALLSYANSIGLDVQDLQPLTGQNLGTGTQSVVLDEKGRGKGLAAWRMGIVYYINEVLDEETQFAFTELDLRDEKQKAEVSSAWTNVSKNRISGGITSADEERQILVDKDLLPKEFEDTTAPPKQEILSETEKPEAAGEPGQAPKAPGAQEGAQPGGNGAQAPSSEVRVPSTFQAAIARAQGGAQTKKEVSPRVREMLSQELEAARELYYAVSDEEIEEIEEEAKE